MKVQAFLCDAVTARENLLHVLGAGVTRLWRDTMPGPMGIDLGILLTLHPLEAQERHRLRVAIQSSDGEEIARLDAEFGIEEQPTPPGEPGARRPGESFVFPLAVPLRQVAVPAHGEYSVEILVDNQHVDSLFFAVAPPAQPQQ